MRLGIQHQRILPGQPQQNGAHERMHKTLKADAIRPPRTTLAAQQRAFNRFRLEYNEERPHEYLRGATPASRYRPSSRPYDARLPPIEYPGHFLVKRITNAGTFRFKRRLLFISHALARTPSDSKKWTMASGRSISVMSFSHGSTNVTRSFGANICGVACGSCRSRGRQERAHRSLENTQNAFSTATTRPYVNRVLPMLPVNFVTYLPGRSYGLSWLIVFIPLTVVGLMPRSNSWKAPGQCSL